MLRTLAVVIAIAAAPAASGQPASDAVAIAPEQRAAIRQLIQRERRGHATLPQGYTLEVGATLPVDIELYMLPEPMSLRQYRYTTVGSRAVLVEPGTRRIVQVIE